MGRLEEIENSLKDYVYIPSKILDSKPDQINWLISEVHRLREAIEKHKIISKSIPGKHDGLCLADEELYKTLEEE